MSEASRSEVAAEMPVPDQRPGVRRAATGYLVPSHAEASDVDDVSAVLRNAVGWPDWLRARRADGIGGHVRNDAGEGLSGLLAAYVRDQVISAEDNVFPRLDRLVTERAVGAAHAGDTTLQKWRPQGPFGTPDANP